LLIVIASCHQKDVKPAQSEKINTEVRVFTNDAPYTGYGYDVYIDGKKYVHQPNIPGLPGNDGFITSEAAQRTGELVAYKIRNNVMPPGLDRRELDSLGVLK